MLSRQDEELESGDYEDVTSKANEMEDFSHDSESQNTHRSFIRSFVGSFLPSYKYFLSFSQHFIG